ncbi:MAG: mannitol dehydrogenase family protein [Actinomycetota bacterium]|nr:mannitol dehydrogenase family protein [Actinomycetota bacterium]
MVALNAANLDRLDPRVARPGYDRAGVSIGIVHLGVGGFHRAHQAAYLDALMGLGRGGAWGIGGVGLLPGDKAMHAALVAQDGLYTVMTRAPDGTVAARVIGSLLEHRFAPADPGGVLDRLAAPATRIVTLTITEGGYGIDPASGRFLVEDPAIAHDTVPGAVPTTVFGYLLAALRRRRDAGIAPFAVVSCDNIESNGTVARTSLSAFARLADPGLAEMIERDVAFPCSMVDRITPVTTPADRAELQERFGIADRWPVVCEPFSQWVLEDDFPAGRPELEAVGVQMVADVAPYEQMKLRLLNAGHQAIAYVGVLAGYRYAHEAVADPLIAAFLADYLREEAQPSLAPVPGIDLDAYRASLLERFSNAALGDTLARLCAQSSDRIPRFVVPVIALNLAAGRSVRLGAAILASWARYAEGRGEDGEELIVVDARRDEVMRRARAQRDDPLAFVRDPTLFGDLAAHEAFGAAYRFALDAFHRLGARGALAALVGGA